MESYALVNKIIPFSSVDGPGNRTSIFLQGCNFDCKYCHNPETRNICVKQCPAKALSLIDGKVSYDISKCCNCDTCIKLCPNGSSPKIREMTSKEVFHEIKKQIPFIRGITVSGGECTRYPQFLEELFRLCQEKKLGTLIDSNGSLDFQEYKSLLNVTDGVMLDVKAYDLKDHIKVTSVSNENVIKVAKYLASIGKLYEVRTVVVPELFCVEQTVEQTARLLAPFLGLKDIRYKLIAYRPMGVRKEYSHYKVPDSIYMNRLASIVEKEGFHNIIII